MKIVIDRIEIVNFKGIRERNIVLSGKNADMRGDNATGKTTVFDAFTWALFGKNSAGRADFDIKPMDKDGNVIHNLETSVLVEFNIDGEKKVFQRVLKEDWRRKRGAAEAEFVGNTLGYYIDTLPKKKSEYTLEISKLIDEDTFKIITDPLYFNEKLSWQDRRKMLLEICGGVDEQDIFGVNPQLLPLQEAKGGGTVKSFLESTKNAMKLINKRLDAIPVQIEEAARAIPEATADNGEQAQLDKVNAELAELFAKRESIKNGADTLKLKAELQRLEFEAKNIEHNVKHPELEKANAAVEAGQKALAATETLIDDIKAAMFDLEQQKDLASDDRAALADEYDRAFSQRFIGENCPTCGQKLPPEELDKRKREFNAEKAARLESIEKRLTRAKQAEVKVIADIVDARGKLKQAGEKLREQEAGLTAAVDAQKEAQSNAFADMKRRKDELAEKIGLTVAAIKSSNESIEPRVQAVNGEIEAANAQKKQLEGIIAEREVQAKQNARIEQLKAEQRDYASKYMEHERLAAMAEEFIRAEVSMLNIKINSKFERARFKLFSEQLNGGLQEVCETMMDGVPYNVLNSAAHIQIGLDIINTISEHKGVYAPIFIDNAESVTNIPATEAQQIRLIVDGDCSVLKISVED